MYPMPASIPCPDVFSIHLFGKMAAERACFGQLVAGCFHIGSLALEIVGNRPPQGRIGNVMGGIGGLRHVAARKLVFALRSGFHPRELVCDGMVEDRKSTRLNSSHVKISYAVFCLK